MSTTVGDPKGHPQLFGDWIKRLSLGNLTVSFTD